MVGKIIVCRSIALASQTNSPAGRSPILVDLVGRPLFLANFAKNPFFLFAGTLTATFASFV
jgi:hypothetical protein